MINHGLTEDDKITRDRDRWRNLVLVKETHCRVDKPLDDDEIMRVKGCFLRSPNATFLVNFNE
jgi:hypothetical protein